MIRFRPDKTAGLNIDAGGNGLAERKKENEKSYVIFGIEFPVVRRVH